MRACIIGRSSSNEDELDLLGVVLECRRDSNLGSWEDSASDSTGIDRATLGEITALTFLTGMMTNESL